MNYMTDETRIATAASWADDTYRTLTTRMNSDNVDADTLDCVADGLRSIADQLFAVVEPPPATLTRPPGRLRVVK